MPLKLFRPAPAVIPVMDRAPDSAPTPLHVTRADLDYHLKLIEEAKERRRRKWDVKGKVASALGISSATTMPPATTAGHGRPSRRRANTMEPTDAIEAHHNPHRLTRSFTSPDSHSHPSSHHDACHRTRKATTSAPPSAFKDPLACSNRNTAPNTPSTHSVHPVTTRTKAHPLPETATATVTASTPFPHQSLDVQTPHHTSALPRRRSQKRNKPPFVPVEIPTLSSLIPMVDRSDFPPRVRSLSSPSLSAIAPPTKPKRPNPLTRSRSAAVTFDVPTDADDLRNHLIRFKFPNADEAAVPSGSSQPSQAPTNSPSLPTAPLNTPSSSANTSTLSLTPVPSRNSMQSAPRGILKRSTTSGSSSPADPISSVPQTPKEGTPSIRSVPGANSMSSKLGEMGRAAGRRASTLSTWVSSTTSSLAAPLSRTNSRRKSKDDGACTSEKPKCKSNPSTPRSSSPAPPETRRGSKGMLKAMVKGKSKAEPAPPVQPAQPKRPRMYYHNSLATPFGQSAHELNDSPWSSTCSLHRNLESPPPTDTSILMDAALRDPLGDGWDALNLNFEPPSLIFGVRSTPLPKRALEKRAEREREKALANSDPFWGPPCESPDVLPELLEELDSPLATSLLLTPTTSHDLNSPAADVISLASDDEFQEFHTPESTLTRAAALEFQELTQLDVFHSAQSTPAKNAAIESWRFASAAAARV